MCWRHFSLFHAATSPLTHWGRVTHICVGNLTIIGSNNDLSPERRQAIIWTNAGILLIGPLGTNFSEILIKIQTFSLKKIRLKMSSAKCCSFRLGLNGLTWNKIVCMGDIYRCIWMKFISMLSMYVQSGTHRHFHQRIVVLKQNSTVLLFGDITWCPQNLAEICSNLGKFCSFRAVAAREKYLAFILLSHYLKQW